MFRYVCLVVLAACLLVGCHLLPQCLFPSPFSLKLVPEAITDSIPKQKCVLLVTVEDEDSSAGSCESVHVSASAPGAAVTVEPESIQPGQVAEITVVPEPLNSSQEQSSGQDEGRTITATIVGRRGWLEETATVPITITSEEEDLVGPLAVEVRDLFIPWLGENHPELGITAQTQWTGTIVTPHILVVTHYLYFSEDWEMHVYWHVMIPPYDWAKIELRRRFTETVPSLVFEIPSRSAPPPLEARAIEPPDTLWR